MKILVNVLIFGDSVELPKTLMPMDPSTVVETSTSEL